MVDRVVDRHERHAGRIAINDLFNRRNILTAAETLLQCQLGLDVFDEIIEFFAFEKGEELF